MSRAPSEEVASTPLILVVWPIKAKTNCIRPTLIGDKHEKNRPYQRYNIPDEVSFYFSCCGQLYFFMLGRNDCLPAHSLPRCCKKRVNVHTTFKVPKTVFFFSPLFFTARRKAIEGKRKVKTEEEELAGNEFFYFPFLLSLFYVHCNLYSLFISY